MEALRVPPCSLRLGRHRVLADDADFSRSTRESIGTNVTKQDADEVFRFIQHYFAGHPTLTSQSEKNGLRSMNKACVELARKAIDLGNIQYASDFLWWSEQRRNEVYAKLMNGTIKNLGVDFGLLRYVNELWDEFVPESDNDPGPSPDDEGGDDDNGGDDDGWSQGDDDEDEPVEDTEPVSVPGDRFTQERKAFAAALSKETNEFMRLADRITISLDLGNNIVLRMVVKWLESGTYPINIITHAQVSRFVLRVTLPWNVARYIVVTQRSPQRIGASTPTTSFLSQSGENVKVVQELLRHASSRTTRDIYQQSDQSAKREALKKFSSLFVVPDAKSA